MADKPMPPAPRDPGKPPAEIDWQRRPVTAETDAVIDDFLRSSGRTR